jgi:hypothetical protein
MATMGRGKRGVATGRENRLRARCEPVSTIVMARKTASARTVASAAQAVRKPRVAAEAAVVADARAAVLECDPTVARTMLADAAVAATAKSPRAASKCKTARNDRTSRQDNVKNRPRTHRRLARAIFKERNMVTVGKELLQSKSATVKARVWETLVSYALGEFAPAAGAAPARQIIWDMPGPPRVPR